MAVEAGGRRQFPARCRTLASQCEAAPGFTAKRQFLQLQRSRQCARPQFSLQFPNPQRCQRAGGELPCHLDINGFRCCCFRDSACQSAAEFARCPQPPRREVQSSSRIASGDAPVVGAQRDFALGLQPGRALRLRRELPALGLGIGWNFSADAGPRLPRRSITQHGTIETALPLQCHGVAGVEPQVAVGGPVLPSRAQGHGSQGPPAQRAGGVQTAQDQRGCRTRAIVCVRTHVRTPAQDFEAFHPQFIPSETQPRRQEARIARRLRGGVQRYLHALCSEFAYTHRAVHQRPQSQLAVQVVDGYGDARVRDHEVLHTKRPGNGAGDATGCQAHATETIREVERLLQTIRASAEPPHRRARSRHQQSHEHDQYREPLAHAASPRLARGAWRFVFGCHAQKAGERFRWTRGPGKVP